MSIRNSIQILKDNAVALNAILNGPETGDGSTVNVNGVLYPSVRKKIAEVANGRFDQLAASVYSAINDTVPVLRASVWVDALNGNDTNPGTQGMPVKTVGAASELVPVGGYGHIYLARNQDHIMDARAYDNKTILIWAAAEEPDNAYWALPSNTAPRLLVTGNQNLRNAQIFIGAYARCVAVKAQGGAFTADIESTGLSAHGSTVCMAHSAISVESQVPIIGGNSPFMPGSLRLRFTKITKPTADGPIPAPLINLPGNTCVGIVEFDAVILPENITLADVVTGIIRDTNGVPRNLLINAVI
ncbi:MAG: hypothetical protein KGZ83_13390 [Sulfuricella sp.]|nr:hypothetical protein [Sulfuricella sp.]